MKDFYTIDEVCHLFEMDKRTLHAYAQKYRIDPQEDQYGNWGFRKVLVRKLHNYIYKEQRGHSTNQGASRSERKHDPWA